MGSAPGSWGVGGCKRARWCCELVCAIQSHEHLQSTLVNTRSESLWLGAADKEKHSVQDLVSRVLHWTTTALKLAGVTVKIEESAL